MMRVVRQFLVPYDQNAIVVEPGLKQDLELCPGNPHGEFDVGRLRPQYRR